jgi:hypothetical protein
MISNLGKIFKMSKVKDYNQILEKILNKKPDDLYFIQMTEAPYHFKIGRAKDPNKRLKQLQTGSSIKLKLVHIFEGLGNKEKMLHEELDRWRLEGEWFACNRYSVGAIPTEFYEKINPDNLIRNNNDPNIQV